MNDFEGLSIEVLDFPKLWERIPEPEELTNETLDHILHEVNNKTSC